MRIDARLMDVGAAIAQHEATIVTVMLAVAGVAFAVLAWVDFATWLDMRGTRDQTALGPALRTKKLAWSAVALGLTVLYLMTFADAVGWYDTGVWLRTVLRLLTITAVVSAAVTGVWFRRAYRREMEQQAR